MFLYIWKMQIFKYLFHFDFISQCWVCKISGLASWELQSQCASSIGREVGFCLAYKEFMKSNKHHMTQGWEVNKFSFLLSRATFRLFLSIYALIKSSSLRFTLYRLHHAHPPRNNHLLLTPLLPAHTDWGTGLQPSSPCCFHNYPWISHYARAWPIQYPCISVP